MLSHYSESPIICLVFLFDITSKLPVEFQREMRGTFVQQRKFVIFMLSDILKVNFPIKVIVTLYAFY